MLIKWCHLFIFAFLMWVLENLELLERLNYIYIGSAVLGGRIVAKRGVWAIRDSEKADHGICYLCEARTDTQQHMSQVSNPQITKILMVHMGTQIPSAGTWRYVSLVSLKQMDWKLKEVEGLGDNSVSSSRWNTSIWKRSKSIKCLLELTSSPSFALPPSSQWLFHTHTLSSVMVYLADKAR